MNGENLSGSGAAPDPDSLGMLDPAARPEDAGPAQDDPTGRQTGPGGQGRTLRSLRSLGQARLGDLLVDAGLITPAQLKDALSSQKVHKNEKIGHLLIRKGYLSEKDLLSALARKFHLHFIDFDHTPPSPLAIKALSEAVAKKMHVAPVELQGSHLLVATANPTDPLLSDYLSFNTGRNIELAVATHQQIAEVHRTCYPGGEVNVDNLIDSMAAVVDLVEEEVPAEQVDESDSKVIQLVNNILLASVKERASDIHFEPGAGRLPLEVRFRVDGSCRLMHQIPTSYKRAVISRLKIMASLDIAERRRPQSGKIFLTSRSGRMEFRVEITPTAGGQEDAVLRVIAQARPLPLDQMGFSADNLRRFGTLLSRPYGIVLCVGPTGAGKTTSLHSALAHLNSADRKIWTAEDPIEITQRGLRQVQVNPNIGFTFQQALRSFLRADPDIIMVGEMRDFDTAKIAVEASLTGHLVFSTLHTNSAAETIARLLEMGIEPFNFADALLGVLAQRLVLKLCDHCKEPYHPTEQEYENLLAAYGARTAQADRLEAYGPEFQLMRKSGCPRCNGTGYLGRMAIHELLIGSEEMKQAIIGRRSVPELRTLALGEGMRTLRMDGIQKVFRGLTDYEQVLKVTL